jgi:hypothetical protein
MTMFLAGTVNPNSLEIAAAICLWASAMALALEDAGIDRRILARAGLAAFVLAQVRGLGALWLACIMVAVITIADSERRTTLLRNKGVILWISAVLASLAFGLWWLEHFKEFSATASPNSFPPTSYVERIHHAVVMVPALFVQMVGVLGWLDTPPPRLSVVAWLVPIGLIFVIGMRHGGRMARRVLVLLLGAVVFVPIVFQVLRQGSLGIFWQGRYSLPMMVGLTIVAGVVASTDAVPHRCISRFRWWVGVALVLGESSLFLEGLKRYAVGLNAPTVRMFDGPWQPPLGAITVTILFVVSVVD